MYCRYCGAEHQENARLCPKCGQAPAAEVEKPESGAQEAYQQQNMTAKFKSAQSSALFAKQAVSVKPNLCGYCNSRV